MFTTQLAFEEADMVYLKDTSIINKILQQNNRVNSQSKNIEFLHFNIR